MIRAPTVAKLLCMHACNTIIAPEIVKPEILLIQKKYIMVALVESIVYLCDKRHELLQEES